VEQARANMITRQEKENARLKMHEIDKYCALNEKGATLLKQAISSLGFQRADIIAFSRLRGRLQILRAWNASLMFR
jgi:predicted ATPase with chaperone activity